MICCAPGCDRPVKARGFCVRHWKQDQRQRQPAFDTWVDMRGRCLNPKHRVYHRYGGRGITLDTRWMTYAGFIADMGERPTGCVIHREDNDGPYTKGNCRWMDRIAHLRYHGAHDRKGVPLAVWAPGAKRARSVAA